MMDNHRILEAMAYMDPSLIEEAAVPAAQKKSRLRPMLIAACLCLLISIPVMAVAGSFLVEHFYGDSIPNNLAEQNLDAFFRASSADKLPLSALSQAASDAAAAQTERVGYYGFSTWDEAESFLGLNILDSDRIQNGYAIPVTDSNGQQVLDAPCHLTLLRNDNGVLCGMNLQYYFWNAADILVSLNANAVTDQTSHDNNSSVGVSNDGATVLQQASENYQTGSGLQATIISTEYSDDHGWTIDGWTQKNSFVIRFSLSSQHEEDGKQAIKDILDSVQ